MRSKFHARHLGFNAALITAMSAGGVFLRAQTATPRQTGDAVKQAQSLLSEAQQLEQARRPQEAIAKAEQAVAALRSAGGYPNAQTLAAMVWLADCCDRNEDFARAQKTRGEILSAAARLYGKEHWKVVDARLAMEDTKRFAVYLHTKRRELEAATAKQREALSRIDEGQYAAAVPIAEEAMSIRKRVLGASHRDYGNSLLALGKAYSAIGDDAQAEPLLRQAVDVIRGSLGIEHPETTDSVEELGNVYQRMGDFTKAERLFIQAIEVNRKALGDKSIATAKSNCRLGGLYIAMKQFERGETLLKQAMAILEKAPQANDSVRLLAVSSLGQLYVATRRNDAAAPLLRNAMELSEKKYGKEHAATAAALGNLAVFYAAAGDQPRAEQTFLSARSILEKTVGVNHPDYAANSSLLADLYEFRGEDAKAEPLLLRSLEMSLRNLEMAAVVQSERQQLAMAEDARRQLDRYMSLALRAPEIREAAYRLVLSWKGSVLARQCAINSVRDDASMKLVYEELQKVVSRLSRIAYAKASPSFQERWEREIAELSDKKERLEGSLAEKSYELRKAQQSSTLEEVRAALPPKTVFIDFVVSQVAKSPGGNDQSGTNIAEPKKYAIGTARAERRLLAFIVRSDAPIELVDLGSAAPIEEHIDQWRADAESEIERTLEGRAASNPQAGQWLRDNVWQPLEDRIGLMTTVLLSPEGPISTLPFAGLPGKRPGTYLIEDWPIAVIPAAQSLSELLRRPPIRSSAARMLLLDAIDGRDAVAGMGKGSDSGKLEPRHYYGLKPGMDNLTTTVTSLYQKRFSPEGLTVITARGANENAFRQEAPRNQYLHLVAHGFYGGAMVRSILNRPTYNDLKATVGDLVRSQSLADYHPSLLSGIALAGAEKPQPWDEDNRVYSAELQTIDLRGVDMVVLSSCQTALGEQAAGEGLVGIQRAFHIAGARTVIATLWKVQVMSSTALLARFYDNLWIKRMNRLDALREAQLWMLREQSYQDVLSKPVAEKLEAEQTAQPLPPYFWAGFVLSGDWTGRVGGSVER